MIFQNIRHQVLRGIGYKGFTRLDHEVTRLVETGKPLRMGNNPGIRVEKDIVRSVEEESTLVACLRQLCADYGSISSDAVLLAQDAKGNVDRFRANVDSRPIRVTGERQAVHALTTQAPWGCGDGLDLGAAPDPLASLVERIAQQQRYALGRCRSLAVEQLRGGHHRADPATSPASRGATSVLVVLQADTVVTLTPDTAWAAAAPGQMKAAHVATASWTRNDIDVLLKRRWMLALTGKMRHEWRWGVRPGVEVGAPHNCICDWWGNTGTLLRREDEQFRIMIDFE